VSDIAILEREVYEAVEAARLLDLPVRTLRNWLDGYSGRGKSYRPVIRVAPTGSDILTWGEFVEAGYLNEYRRVHKISLPEIRSYIDKWRGALGVPYPLAHEKPYAGPGPGLVEQGEGSDGEPVMWRHRDGQLMMTKWAERFVNKVEFGPQVARRYFPAGKEHPVVIDPRRSFGAPTVEGVRTEVLFEMFLAGEPVDEIAAGYELDRNLIEAAIRFESPRPKPDSDAAAA
jgi:uncharacterized protein (DUF433 family)